MILDFARRMPAVLDDERVWSDRKVDADASLQARRAEKKTRQQTFGDERRRQIASHKKQVEGGKAADVRGATLH